MPPLFMHHTKSRRLIHASYSTAMLRFQGIRFPAPNL